MYGIFVRDNAGVRYAHAIVNGQKPIETRSQNMLRGLVGKRVAVVRTRSGKLPTVVGFATISRSEFMSSGELDGIRNLTLIPEDSRYDCKGAGKWCYHMTDPVPCDEFLLPSNATRHGRSWCEFFQK